ncbi:MAG TPA: hypothetical protein VFS30_03390 [Dehalococcoidia bacterium]|nr:hypothetical protein [Dehalococcoidia bacterium]
MKIGEVIELAQRDSLTPLQKAVLEYMEAHDDEVFSYRDEKLIRDVKSKPSAVGFTLWALHKKGLIEKEKVGRKVYFGSNDAIAELRKRTAAPAEDDWFEKAGSNREAIFRKHGYVDVLALLDEVREGR